MQNKLVKYVFSTFVKFKSWELLRRFLFSELIIQHSDFSTANQTKMSPLVLNTISFVVRYENTYTRLHTRSKK